jgi:hypothetical protein
MLQKPPQQAVSSRHWAPSEAHAVPELLAAELLPDELPPPSAQESIATLPAPHDSGANIETEQDVPFTPVVHEFPE